MHIDFPKSSLKPGADKADLINTSVGIHPIPSRLEAARTASDESAARHGVRFELWGSPRRSDQLVEVWLMRRVPLPGIREQVFLTRLPRTIRPARSSRLPVCRGEKHCAHAAFPGAIPQRKSNRRPSITCGDRNPVAGCEHPPGRCHATLGTAGDEHRCFGAPPVHRHHRGR